MGALQSKHPHILPFSSAHRQGEKVEVHYNSSGIIQPREVGGGAMLHTHAGPGDGGSSRLTEGNQGHVFLQELLPLLVWLGGQQSACVLQ